MSMASAQGRKTPVGDASGIVGGDGMALSGGINAAAIAEMAAFQDPTAAGNANFSYNGGESGGSLPLPAAAALFLSGFDFANFLSGLFGGGSGGGLSWNQIVKQGRVTRAGKHPLYTRDNGISNTLIVDQVSDAQSLQQRDAPSAYEYYEWAKTASFIENLENIYEFHRGGSMDAQRYGASQAYANYVYGVYMAARGYPLWFALRSAEAYGLKEDYSKYHRPMSKRYPGIPAANVANITRGFNDERAGKFGLP
jgi:hypothetical protein